MFAFSYIIFYSCLIVLYGDIFQHIFLQYIDDYYYIEISSLKQVLKKYINYYNMLLIL